MESTNYVFTDDEIQEKAQLFQRGSSWLFKSFDELTGTHDPEEAGRRLADIEIGKLLKMKGCLTLEGSVPVLDLFSLHDNIYPFILYHQQLIRHGRNLKGLAEFNNGYWEINIGSDTVEEEHFTIVHEIAHTKVRSLAM